MVSPLFGFFLVRAKNKNYLKTGKNNKFLDILLNKIMLQCQKYKQKYTVHTTKEKDECYEQNCNYGISRYYG